MVNHQIPQQARLDAVFGALSDPTRRALLSTLSHGPSTVGDLAAPFPISLAAVSKHLKVLESAGLVKRTIEGRVHHCRLDARPLHDGFDWIRRYERWWNERLDVLEGLLEDEIDHEKRARRKPDPKRAKSAPPAIKPKRSKP
jgi:DNA-binding transcriptional ArsR family regulator